MYLLIDEDRGEPIVGERTPPWGAPNAAEYVGRIRRNLESLDKLPGLRLNYDFAAVDLESIARDFPDVISTMKQMVDRGVLGFINGGYSQCHHQVLGSESNWRDLEYGLAVYEKLFGIKVKVWGHQETSLTQQLPQILSRFGYTMAAMPNFPWAMEITAGPFDLDSSQGAVNILAGDEFIEAQALDGTALPVYLNPRGRGRMESLENVDLAVCKDMYGPPPIWMSMPDMDEVAQETYDAVTALAEIVLLEKALAERIKAAPPRAKARIFSYYSYNEGVWAEELWRKNREAEESALLAEAVQAMARRAGSKIDRNGDIRNIWHTIIKYHNHDVSWIEVTDMRRKAINLWSDGIAKSRQIVEDIGKDLAKPDNESIAVFNGLPAPRKTVLEIRGEDIPGGGPQFQEFEGRSFGVRDLPAGGFKSFPIAKTPRAPSKEVAMPGKISTANYGVTLSGNGLIEQITTAGRKDLLTCDKYLGGEMRALINDEWADNRTATCKFYEGDRCYILTRSASLGNIPILERYFFFRDVNLIKAELEFDFNGNEVGYYWIDETKLNVYYPTRGSDVHYDVAFGHVTGRERRPLFAINWLYCGGLAYLNRGTVKHWVRDGVIANVLAWGSRNFNNRSGAGAWRGAYTYDIRLYGKQKVEYMLIPHGDFDGNRIVHDVNALMAPVFLMKGTGERSFYEVKDHDLAVTAVYEKDDKVWARGYRLPSKRKSKYRDWEIFDAPISDLA
jgi:hypothetical protein